MEYEAEQAECPFCGCKLVPGSIEPIVAEPQGRQRKRDEFIELCRPSTFPIAMLVKQMLEQNEVDVIVKGAHSMSVLPQLAFCGELRILVRAVQIDFARELYSAYFQGDGMDGYEEE